MIDKIYTIILFMSICLFSACQKNDKQKVSELMNKWNNKEIVFPNKYEFAIYGKKHVDFSFEDADYKVLVYVDSTGCVGCKLQLEQWQWFIEKLDSISNHSIPVVFFIHPEDKYDIQDLLKAKKFNHPICLDLNNQLYQLNKFPNDLNFQTFLLNKENRVVLIGNPIHNLNLWELYFEVIEEKLK